MPLATMRSPSVESGGDRAARVSPCASRMAGKESAENADQVSDDDLSHAVFVFAKDEGKGGRPRLGKINGLRSAHDAVHASANAGSEHPNTVLLLSRHQL